MWDFYTAGHLKGRKDRKCDRCHDMILKGSEYWKIKGKYDPNNFFSNDFFNRRTTLQGVNAAVTLFPFETFGITGDLSYNRKNRTLDITDGTDSEHTDVWYFLAGPSYVFPTTGRFQPIVSGC